MPEPVADALVTGEDGRKVKRTVDKKEGTEASLDELGDALAPGEATSSLVLSLHCAKT